MKEFESTKTLMKMLESGRYKCLVMENDEEETIDFDIAAERYKARISSPGNYDYFTRRQIVNEDI